MNLQLVEDLVKVIRYAIEDPTDKAAAQLALDALDAWADIATRPSILKLEADTNAYMALRAKSASPAHTPLPGSAADVPLDNAVRTQTPQQLNQWQADHPNG